jgi:hypothetical protein
MKEFAEKEGESQSETKEQLQRTRFAIRVRAFQSLRFRQHISFNIICFPPYAQENIRSQEALRGPNPTRIESYQRASEENASFGIVSPCLLVSFDLEVR